MKDIVTIKGVRHLAVDIAPDETNGFGVRIPCLRRQYGRTRFWVSKVEQVEASVRCCWRCEKALLK